MPKTPLSDPVGAEPPRRVFYFNAGFLRQQRIRRILELAGYPLQLGKPDENDLIAVWGHSPFAKRGEVVAETTGAGLIRVEDAFLRSIRPGREGEPPLGLLIDTKGVHFDSSQPSDLENLLATHPLDDTALMDRARNGIEYLRENHLSKYNGFDPAAACPEPGYVLVIDQTRNDASVTHGQANANSFREMLYYAQEDNPGAKILIKTHPETNGGHRDGYFGPTDATDRISLLGDPVSPWALFDGAVAVYTVSSHMGFEAIFAGHKPRVFGQPFYAGWGLTEDRHPVPLLRRGRNLSRAQLFAASMILYPTWYDTYRDRLCSFEEAATALESQARCWREDHEGWAAHGMRLWKRKPLQRFFGQHCAVIFRAKDDRPAMVWARHAGNAPAGTTRVEDGFLRSRGLGAELVPPLSLICDDLGIYYDPTHPSRLENLIARRVTLRRDQKDRAERLMANLIKYGVTKYNLDSNLPDLPSGHCILVPGQVEDDASVLTGAGAIATNVALVRKTRQMNPDAVILYKPHPDVEAGLRSGRIDPDDLTGLVDMVLDNANPASLLGQVDEVWTMTSLIGFEALIRGLPVTTTGAPFYAGWGLTRDLGATPARRTARPGLAGLVHATLIDYPRYHDPVTARACPAEVVVDRLATDRFPRPGAANRLLARLQGVFASYAGIWR